MISTLDYARQISDIMDKFLLIEIIVCVKNHPGQELRIFYFTIAEICNRLVTCNALSTDKNLVNGINTKYLWEQCEIVSCLNFPKLKLQYYLERTPGEVIIHVKMVLGLNSTPKRMGKILYSTTKVMF